MSTSSGWLTAKATARANESAGIATSAGHGRHVDEMPGLLPFHMRQRRGNAVQHPLMFTSIIRSHSSILRRSIGACGISPALLIITSMRP